MKYLVFLSMLFFSTLQTFGQQEYFIYLQTDNNQAFYIRANNSVYSSSASGFCILSRLPDTSTSITIGFPGNVFPEQQFNIPLNHKDGGYTLSNGSKGWALLNLQTGTVIMTSTVPQEKKNVEITGNKRTDAFSMLLANAVNDTAVLYTIVRPPKPLPPPLPVLATEKKPSAQLLLKNDSVKKDLPVITKKPLPKKDSSTVKITGKPNNAKAGAGRFVPAGKAPVVAAKNKQPAHDTAMLTKNTHVVGPALKKDSSATAKHPVQPKQDSIIVISNKAGVLTKKAPGLAKNRKERKDTIIIMNGKSPAGNKLVAKNTPVVKGKPATAALANDSVQLIQKKILQAPEEKRDALLNNKDAVQVERVPVKKDTAAPRAVAETVVPVPAKTDSLISPAPVKRMRPLVTKAAELFTDTSYIAVFVDESADKFDTVRISIPFIETAATYQRQKPALVKTDTVTEKTPMHNAVTVTPDAATPVKKDSLADKITKDSSAARQATPVTVTTVPVNKADSTAVTRKGLDNSTTTTTVPPTMPVPVANAPETTTTATTGKKDSATDMIKRGLPQTLITKDSNTAAPLQADSGRRTKDAGQPLILNSDCKEVAQDGDIDKLRIKMLLMTTDEDRISVAKRLFRQKCLLVKQVKALSELFKSDEGKYKWFDAAYPFIIDTGNFPSLSELIKDDYYLNRFKAMLRH